MNALELQDLHFGYGARAAVKDVSLRLQPGDCYGFLGHNGAGKTTVMRLCLGLLRPSRGAVRIFGAGALIDLPALRARTREVGAALVLDVAQSCGAWPLDVAEVQPDFLVAVTYKWLLGPYSLGFLYVAPEHRGGAPLEHPRFLRERDQEISRLGRDRMLRIIEEEIIEFDVESLETFGIPSEEVTGVDVAQSVGVVAECAPRLRLGG